MAFTATVAWKLIIVMCGVAAVSVLACAVRSRLVLVLGLAGIFLAQLVPEARVYEDFQHFSVDAAMAAFVRHKQHTRYWTVVGACVGSLAGLLVIAIQDLYATRRERAATDIRKRSVPRRQ